MSLQIFAPFKIFNSWFYANTIFVLKIFYQVSSGVNVNQINFVTIGYTFNRFKNYDGTREVIVLALAILPRKLTYTKLKNSGNAKKFSFVVSVSS